MTRSIVAQYYEESIPEAAKEVDRLAQSTLARVEAMRQDAFKRLGYYNPKFLRTETEKIDHDKMFPIGPRGASDNAPKLKLGELLAEKAVARENLIANRAKETSG